MAVDYILENRSFTDADGYSLSIELPLKGCRENIAIFGHIDRLDADYLSTSWPGVLSLDGIYKYGSVAVTEITPDTVKVQFLEGRSAQNFDVVFDEIYINSLALDAPNVVDVSQSPLLSWKSIDDGADYVVLPWYNKTSGVVQNEVTGTWRWRNTEDFIPSAQPYLLWLVKSICGELEYTVDFTEWEQSPYRHLIVCNALPASWGMNTFADALPKWSVTELFEQLELLLNGEFDIDHVNHHISFRFFNSAVENIAPQEVDRVLEEMAVSISEETSVYREDRSVRYNDDGSEAFLRSCDWYIDDFKDKAITFSNMAGLCRYAINYRVIAENTTARPLNRLLYAETEQIYCIMRWYSRQEAYDSNGNIYYENLYELVPINRFAPLLRNSSEESELKFVPVQVERIPNDGVYAIALEPGEEERDSTDTPDGESGNAYSTLPEQILQQGDVEENTAVYDRLYIGFWIDEEFMDRGQPYPYPLVDSFIIHNCYYTPIEGVPGLSLRGNILRSLKYRIDAGKKYNISFLHNGDIDPRSLFYIHGKRYLCKSLHTTIGNDVVSSLYKGEFYRVVD